MPPDASPEAIRELLQKLFGVVHRSLVDFLRGCEPL
jgi:hypothetical protein